MIEYKMYNEDQIFNCYSSSLASICTLQNLEFAAMFLKNWSMVSDSFILEDRIGGNVFINSERMTQSLLDFHGISVTNTEIENEKDFYSYYKNNHLSEFGCAVSYDSFWAPWLMDYQKTHNSHMSLVKGMDDSGNLICADGIPYLEEAYLPLSPLFSEKTVTVLSCIKVCEIDNIDYPAVLKDLHNSLYDKKTPFQLITNYGDIVKNNFKQEKENIYDGQPYWYLAPFLIDLKTMAQQRKSMAYSLEYLYNRYHDEKLCPLKNGLEELSDLWYQLLMVCWKILLSHQYSNGQAREIISNSIYECAEKEKIVSEKLLL